MAAGVLGLGAGAVAERKAPRWWPIAEGVEGIARSRDLVGAHVDDPAEVVGIETNPGLVVARRVRNPTGC
ncbi:MAG: hypothetical protein ACRDVP_05240 [Acidimicrobiales bacterium]